MGAPGPGGPPHWPPGGDGRQEGPPSTPPPQQEGASDVDSVLAGLGPVGADGGLGRPKSSGATRQTTGLDCTMGELPRAPSLSPAGCCDKVDLLDHVHVKGLGHDEATSDESVASGTALALMEVGDTPPPRGGPPAQSRPRDIEEWADRRAAKSAPDRPCRLSAPGGKKAGEPQESAEEGDEGTRGPPGSRAAVGQTGPVPDASTAGADGGGGFPQSQGPQTIDAAFALSRIA